MSDSTSIFYQIGQATKSNVTSAITALKAANNTWTGTNNFNEEVTVGAVGDNANLVVNGDVTASGQVEGSSVVATGALSGASASITNTMSAGSVSSIGAVSGASLSATGAVSGATLSTTGNVTIGGGATISGDLTVNGTTTTVSTNNLDIKDSIITLNDGAKSVSTTASDSGLLLERKQGADNAAILFQETDSRFEVGTTTANGSSNFGTVSLGALAVNSLLVGTRASTQALGDLADFNAGLSA